MFLLFSCWSKDIHDRPSMNDIVYIMSKLIPFFPGGDEDLINETEDFSDKGNDYDTHQQICLDV